MLFYFTFRVPISDFVNHSCKYDQSALLVNYRKNKSPVDFDVTSRSRAQTPGKRSLAEYFIVKLRFGERESHLVYITEAVAAAPSVPSSSTLRKVLVRTSLTITFESLIPEKSPAKLKPRSFSIGFRAFSYFTSNFGRLSFVKVFSIPRDFPLMTFGWKTFVFQLNKAWVFSFSMKEISPGPAGSLVREEDEESQVCWVPGTVLAGRVVELYHSAELWPPQCWNKKSYRANPHLLVWSGQPWPRLSSSSPGFYLRSASWRFCQSPGETLRNSNRLLMIFSEGNVAT